MAKARKRSAWTAEQVTHLKDSGPPEEAGFAHRREAEAYRRCYPAKGI